MSYENPVLQVQVQIEQNQAQSQRLLYHAHHMLQPVNLYTLLCTPYAPHSSMPLPMYLVLPHVEPLF